MLTSVNEQNAKPKKLSFDYYKNEIIIIIATIIVVLVMRSFVFQAYRIPTGSMENTLLPGDYILVNKLAYCIQTPVLFEGTRWQINSHVISRYGAPKLGDIAVFRFPRTFGAIDDEEGLNYIKRVMGTPGDTIVITNKLLSVNDKLIPLPETGFISENVKSPLDVSERIYPTGQPWNEDQYGPIVVPKQGMVIPLNYKMFKMYAEFIKRDMGTPNVEMREKKVYINGELTTEYTVKQNYYFALGDNRDDSMDSRFWGFVPEDHLIGSAGIVYFSRDPYDEEFFSSIRWERVLKSIE